MSRREKQRIRSIREAAHQWRVEMSESEYDQKKQAAFDRWIASDPLHAEAYAEAEILWKALGGLGGLGGLDIEHPRARAFMEEPPSIVDISNWRGRLVRGSLAASAAMAACLLILVATGLLSLIPSEPLRAHFETTRSEIDAFILADGTEVTLGARSRIEFIANEDTRHVHLVAGEAYFDVTSDPVKPFIVMAGPTQVRVTGTAFEVQRKAGALHVAVAEGAVRVIHTAGTKEADGVTSVSRDMSVVELKAGQGVRASRDQGLGVVVEMPPEKLGAWRSGELYYVRATLAEVISDANRYSEIPIKLLPPAQEMKLSGTFSAQDINGLLSMVDAALPVQVINNTGAQIIVAPE